MGKTALVLLMIMLFVSFSFAEVVDRVVAFVDEEAITQSDFERQYMESAKASPGASKEEVLDGMINRILILREAESLRLRAPSEEEIINEYIELRIRAYVRIPEKDIRLFYNENKSRFGGASFSSVSEKIEKLLQEERVNAKLKEHLAELRSKSFVKIVHIP